MPSKSSPGYLRRLQSVEIEMKPTRFRSIKRELRIVGIDDDKLHPPKSKRSSLIGVIFRGGEWLDGVLRTTIKTDGTNATDKITKMIKGSSHYSQIRVLMLYGLTFAGFNVVNLKRLYERVERPVIVVMRDKPDYSKIEEAAKRLNDWEDRLRLIKDAGEPIPVTTRENAAPIYLQAHGIDIEDAVRIVKLASKRDSLPEPVRVANIIASSLRSRAYKPSTS